MALVLIQLDTILSFTRIHDYFKIILYQITYSFKTQVRTKSCDKKKTSFLETVNNFCWTKFKFDMLKHKLGVESAIISQNMED